MEEVGTKMQFSELDLILQFPFYRESKYTLTLIDVGAHIGSFAKPFVEKGWRAIAFEPEPENRGELENNLGSYPNVSIIPKAVSDRAGEEIPFYISSEHWGIHSLKPFHDSHKPELKVETVRLDTTLKELEVKQVSLLKIDVEGADFLALQGFDFSTIKPEIVICEFMDERSKSNFGYSHHDMAFYMEKYGYYLFVSEWAPIKEYGRKGVTSVAHKFLQCTRYPLNHQPSWGNLIFVRSDRLVDFEQTLWSYLDKFKMQESLDKLIGEVENALQKHNVNQAKILLERIVQDYPYYQPASLKLFDILLQEGNLQAANYVLVNAQEKFPISEHISRRITFLNYRKKELAILADSNQKLLAFKDKHKGERCVIIGNGPSLNKMDLSFFKNEICFGMNRIYLGFEKWDFTPNYYVSVNPLVLEQSAGEISKISCPKFISNKGIPYFLSNSDIIFVNTTHPQSNFTDNPQTGINEGYTVTYVAMQLAYYMGFKTVILIGVDHNFVTKGDANKEVVSQGDDPNHFHPHYFGKGVKWNLPDLKNSEKFYRIAEEYFRANNRQIIDATVDGNCRVFSKADYRELFFNQDLLKSKLTSSNETPINLKHSIVKNKSINTGQLNLQRQFWNVNSLDEAMFARVFTDDKIKAMSPQEKMEAWENSVLSSTQKVIQGIPIKTEWKVLEIGCGVGRIIKYLREKFARVNGVDISENMIQFAKKYLADGKQNGEVYVNNGYDLQILADQSYDFVYSTIVFQHIRSISIVKSYFRETFRVLKPGGYFRLQVHDYSALSLGNFDEEGTENQQYYFSGNAYTDTQLKDLLLGEINFDLVALECSKPWIWITVKRPEKQIFSPLVSAIVSTYNSEKFIQGCLEDLVTQTLYQKGKLEIIIIDSASTEKEGAIAQEFQSKYPHIIYYRTSKRETIYAAWNRAIKIAKGNFITNANTDDRHRPDALEKMGNHLNNNSEISLVYADQLVTTLPNDSWATTQANKHWNWPEFNYQELERRCIIGPQPMWRKSLHEKYGYFRSEFKVAGDYEFWLRIGKTEKIARLPKILGLYFENQQGLEKSSAIAYIETQEIWKTYGIIDRKVKPKISMPVPINPLEINTSPSTKTLQSTEKKFHVLLYTDEPGIYGVGQCNHSILCELIKYDYIVSCVQSKTSNYLIEQQKKLGIQHFWLEYDTVKNFSQTLTNLDEAKQLLTKIKPDRIIFSDCCPFSNLAAKQVAIKLEIPFVVLVNFAAPYLAKRFHSYLRKLSEIYAYSRQTIAVSQENLHQLWELFQLPKQSGKVIYNGRPSQYFTPVNSQVRSRLRQQLGIPENAVVCFTSARLEAIKGYQYQLEAIKFLKRSNVWSQIYFVWVGSGSLESQLNTEISQLGVTDKVKLLGERDDIPELLDSADIFVFPSQFEGMPLAIMEAMAKGLPVVASAVSGIPEELGETGKLLPDPKIDSQTMVKELVETIQEWTLNPNLRYSIAQNCQQRAEKMFTEERMLTETLEVIKSTLPNQKPLVSVIIPCYKQAHFLSEAVASVVSQTYNNWEIIIVNDGSPDNTSEVARHIIKLFPHHKIDLVEKEKGGCASARNSGINRANGDYILPLDADDKLSSYAISCLMDIAISKSHACVVFGSYEIFGTEERKIITVDEYSLQNLKKYNMLVCTSLYAKSIYNLTNGYKEEIQESGYEDWEFWLNCHRHNIPFYGVRETILYYRRHSESRVVKSFPDRNYYRAQVISYYPDLFDAETIKKTEDILTSNKTLEDTEYNLEKIAIDVKEYKQNPQNRTTLTNLQTWRQKVAKSWLNLGTEKLENAYINSVGKAHKILINCGLQSEILTAEEQSFVNEIKTYLILGLNQPKALQYLLAGMLYGRADRLQLKFDKAPIPKWFANDYLKYMFSSPSLFLEIGEADNYARYMEKWLKYINDNITNNPDSKLWQEIALIFTQNANFIPIYFASFNLKKIYSLRAQIIEFSLKSQGNQIDYEFPTRNQNRNKIRLGIIKEHFIPQSETYSTLPVFEHLNREKFEIILYTNKLTNNPLEEYCCNCVDRVVKLENDTQKQVQTIRNDDLDILVVGSNITAITRPITLLMFHRLARIQATLFSSPVTTGIRNIDYYISGKLSEIITVANQHYTEKLALLENVGFCFNYYSILSTPAQVYPTRQSWKATDETIIFISGANFYKIIPELAETWAKILVKIPNSILVLYPFAPSWSSQYPAIAFLNRMHRQLAKYKLEKKRLVLIKALPTRADVKECLKQADIYLDSYPYSGSNSLVDPLEVGIPTVVMDGEFLRQKQGAALLRSLSIPDLISDSEAEYIDLAIKLANNLEFRQQKQQEIQEKMQQNPSFLDSRSYSAKIGKLFQELFEEWQNVHLPKTIESQDKNSLTSEFINRLVGCVNLYKIDPNDKSLIEELRQLRKQIADFWLDVPPKNLETIYQGKVRQAYLTLLASGIQNEPQTEEEEKFIKELTDTSIGLTNPKGINALLGGMLYFPPGKMLVRDAKNRLPQWLINDYKQVFESREVAQKLEKAFQTKSPHLSEDYIGRGLETKGLETKGLETKGLETKPLQVNVVLTENKADNLDSAHQKFLNQLLGSVNLYYIDPSDESVVKELRQLRKQTADFWINLEPQKLEIFYLGEMGKGYQELLNSQIQNESLIESEQEFLQELATQLSQGIEAPKAINYLLAAMLYCRPQQLQIEDMDKLPHWLLEDYQKFAGNG